MKIKTSLFITFLIVFTIITTTFCSAAQTGREHYFAGISAYKNKNYDISLDHFEKADQKGIDDPEMFFRIAHIYDIKKNNVQASKYFLIAADRFEKHDPKNPLHSVAYNNLGAILIKMNQAKAAEAALKRAKKLAPANTLQLLNLATLFTNNNQYEQAVRCYNLILLLEPENIDAFMDRVRCLAHSGNTEEAMSCLENFLDHSPKNAVGLYNLGVLYMQSGYFAKSTLQFEKALKLGLKNPKVYINLGLLAQIYEKDRYRANAFYRKYLAMGGKEKQLVTKLIKNLRKKPTVKNEKKDNSAQEKKTEKKKTANKNRFNIGF